jgi:prepilin-type N-terminal cleavage/methylation domain-containing protein
MTFTLPELVIVIVIAAICGAVAKALAGGGPGGLITSIALGFIGALLGPWVALQLHLAEPIMLHVSGQAFPIVWSIVGAALFVALLHLLSGRRWARA